MNWTTVGCMAVAALALAGCSTSSGGTASDDSVSSTPSSAATKASPKASAKPTAAALTFPGAKKNDKIVKPGVAVKLSGWTTTAAALKKANDDAFGPQLCADVTMTNRDSKPQSYNIYSWQIQSPSGDVKDVTISASNNAWGNGDLAPKGRKTGTICFDDPGQPGTYVVLWQPDQFSSDARGAWVNTVS